jgi:epoxide hydrolase-like predicted phosphatase
MPDTRAGRARGLLVDFGGVLTTSVADSFRAFCLDEGLPADLALTSFLRAHGAGEDSAVHRIETGRITPQAFAEQLAAFLSAEAGVRLEPDGLVDRMFAGMRPDQRMLDGVAAARRAGVRTGLLSNSWGGDRYPRARFSKLFDAVVISGEVGLRKPDPAIYSLAAQRLELPPSACVFVDDIPVNVHAAEQAGMIGVVHRLADETLPRLAELLDLPVGVLAP